MFGTTCDFGTRTAALSTDYDFPGTDEEIQDGGDDPVLGFATVTVSHLGFHVTVPDAFDAWDVPVAGDVVHGRRVDGGVAVITVLDGACVARWYELDSVLPGPRVEVPDEACDADADVAVDPASGDLFVATDDGVWVLTSEGPTLIDVRADLLAWDPWSGALYASMDGSETVRAHELDGSLRWSTELDGEIVVLDGATGDARLTERTPAPAAELVAAAGGGVLGLVLADEVHFYDVSVP
jgi:hypothetical protein